MPRDYKVYADDTIGAIEKISDLRWALIVKRFPKMTKRSMR